jgi:hypothetical protein
MSRQHCWQRVTMRISCRLSPVFRVLLISDGLSDATTAGAASRELLSRRIPVDVILIDPGEKGNDLARRVAGGYDSVTAVTSASEMVAADQLSPKLGDSPSLHLVSPHSHVKSLLAK